MNIENCKTYNTENIRMENKLECKVCEDEY